MTLVVQSQLAAVTLWLIRGGVDLGRGMIQASGMLLLVMLVALELVALSWWPRRL